MGTEWAQPGWWNNDEHHSPNWQLVRPHPASAGSHPFVSMSFSSSSSAPPTHTHTRLCGVCLLLGGQQLLGSDFY